MAKFSFEQKNKQKYELIIALIIAVILLATIFYFFSQKTSFPTTSQQTQIVLEQNSLVEKRKEYGFSTAVFENLPTPPIDFEKLVSLMHEKKYVNYSFFSKDYYLQPEFYPGFRENGYSYWLNPDPDHYAVSGFGFYPFNDQETHIKAGETITTSFFVKSGWGIQSYQGIKIFEKTKVEGIEIKIVEPEFLLGYTYPEFSPNWVKKVDLIITILPGTPKGIYPITLNFTDPSYENKEKWLVDSARNYYDKSFSFADFSKQIRVWVIE